MDLPQGSMRAVLDYCGGLPLVHFAPGEVMIPEGPATGHMFILVSGEVEVLRGETTIAETHEPGAVFGEIAALLGTRHSATVRAVNDVAAYRIDDARQFLQTETGVMFHVGRILAQRLVDATTYLADIKRQFADRDDHLGMVDEVLDALVQRQKPAVPSAPSRSDDPRLRS